MPPKKKVVTQTNAVAQTSANVPIPTTLNLTSQPSTLSNGNGTTTTTNNATTTTIPTTLTTQSTALKKIQWYWAGDSGTAGMQQDVLVEYDSKMNSEIESQYQQHSLKPKLLKFSKFKIDKDRYIDFKKMVQTRYDDPNKMRTVERKEIIAGTPPPIINTKASIKRRKQVISSDSDSSGDSDSASSSDSSSSSSESESDDTDSEDDEDYVAKWSWAGDSNGGPSKGGGHQDVWIAYDLKMCKKLENAFKKNKKKYKVDNERFVDFQNMLQRRIADESKRRNLKREDPLKVRATTSTSTAASTALSKAQQISKAKTAMANTHTSSSPPQTTTTTSTAPITRQTSTTTNDTVISSKPKLVPTVSSISIASIIKCPSTWTNVDSMEYKEVDVKSGESEFKWMSKMFSQTISSNHKGMSTLSPVVFNDLKVTRLVRVQNPMQWVSYHARKQKILDDNKGNCPPIQKVLTVIPDGPEVDTKANEFFLFHGLNISSVPGIAKFGFDPRFCSLEGMFGAGLYFAENSSKSNQYCHSGACTCSGFQATSCRCSAKDEVCLLVCRVVMGDSLVENVFRGNKKGEFWHGRRTEPKKPDGVSIYNSVIGESKPNYGSKALLQLREYIVYESSQVFCEYKVYFKRV